MMDDKALEICRKYHDKLIAVVNSGGAGHWSGDEINDLQYVMAVVYKRGIRTCCNPGHDITEIAKAYEQYLKNNG